MANELRKDTGCTITLGPAISPTDGVTPYNTGTATLSTVVQILKNGVNSSLGTLDLINTSVDGYYSLVLDSGNTDTMGSLKVEIPGVVATYGPLSENFNVLSPNFFDAKYGTLSLNVALAPDQPNAVVFAQGIVINQSQSNAPAIQINGNGSGDGIQINSGGFGITLITSNSGIYFQSQSSGIRARFSRHPDQRLRGG